MSHLKELDFQQFQEELVKHKGHDIMHSWQDFF